MDKNFKIEVIPDSCGIADVKGFSVAGVACDIRNKNDYERLDLALICADTPAAAAGVFTSNDVKAAPVYVDCAHLKSSAKIKAIVANSGNANACTGAEGMRDANEECALVAQMLGVEPCEVLVSSTGRIGELLPMEKVKRGIAKAVEGLSKTPEASMAAAHAIMTSDTRPKTVTVRVSVGDKSFSFGGMAKGAGMIEPNMATMLCYIATDALADRDILKECLLKAVNRSFNRITIDGDMSTNDTVICLAGGASGVEIKSAELIEAFAEGLKQACQVLARKIVGDGEKITKVINFKVCSAATPEQAEKICRSVANSLLVKSAWFGADPNWGRIIDAAGYARTGIDFGKVDLYYGDVPAIIKGEPQHSNKELWKKVVSAKEFEITLSLNMGKCSESILTTDLTTGYVEFNKGE